jgi:hypothetical protein
MNNEPSKTKENPELAPDGNTAPEKDELSISNEDTHSFLEHKMKSRFAQRRTFSERGDDEVQKSARRRTHW